ncbi:hypothetical protein YC2023_083312 [Brassica napus]
MKEKQDSSKEKRLPAVRMTEYERLPAERTMEYERLPAVRNQSVAFVIAFGEKRRYSTHPSFDYAMSSAQDPFYIVKEEIQDSIDKLQSAFHKWERISPGMGDQVHVTKELLANCGSIEWQVDELEKAVNVAAKDPALYGIDEAELERRRRWTSNARTQVRNVKTGVLAGKGSAGAGNASEVRRELMRMPNSSEASRYDQYGGRDDDGFVQSESDRQMLLIKQQDEELDELSKSVERIGGVGLTIHDELVAQERIIDELGFSQLSLLVGKKKRDGASVDETGYSIGQNREFWIIRNHRITTQMQRRIYGHATDVEIRPLDEDKAVQAAVDLIGELFIFAVGGGVVIFEVQRSSRSETRKEEARKQELEELRRKDEEIEKKIVDLQSRLAEVEQLAQARGLTGMFKLRQQPNATKGSDKPADTSAQSSSS